MVLLQRATDECLAGSDDGDADNTRRRLTPQSLADFGELFSGTVCGLRLARTLATGQP
jgi:hypothetical protein